MFFINCWNFFNQHNVDFMTRDVDDRKNLIIGSMDVKALYPSIDLVQACQDVELLVEKYGDRIEGAAYGEAARYLALVLTEKEVLDEGLSDVLPQLRTNRGMKPGITSPEVSNTPLNKEVLKEESRLTEPIREPSAQEQKRILAKCLARATHAAMSNHVFQLGGDIYSQDEGLPMGNPLTGVLARIEMLHWDRAFCSLIDNTKDINRSLHKRYVDDHLGGYRALEKGARWDPELKEVTYGTVEEAQEDTRQPDVRTMDVVRAAANTISKSLQFTSDTPSQNNSKSLPVLDITCWVEEGTILYEHFRKPMAARESLLKDSALPAKTKRTVQSQEVVRILRNCHPEVPWSRKAEHLSQFMQRLRTSGYPQGYRAQILESGIAGYEKMLKVEMEGGRPVNRPDSCDKTSRKKRKIVEEKTWYRRGGNDTVLFVPTTPGSELASRMREIALKNNQGRDWQVKIVETSGRSVKSMLQRADPTPPKPCQDQDCMSCPQGIMGECCKEGAVYRVHCTHPSCGEGGARYWGESARTLSLRRKEHSRGLEKEMKESPMWNHCVAEHQGEKQSFKMKIVSTHLDPLSRLIKEGVVISRDNTNLRMNSRSNFRQPKVTRSVRTRNLGEVVQQGEQQHNSSSNQQQRATPTTNGDNSRSQEQGLTTQPPAEAVQPTVRSNSSNNNSSRSRATRSQGMTNPGRGTAPATQSSQEKQQSSGESSNNSSNNSNGVGKATHNNAPTTSAAARTTTTPCRRMTRSRRRETTTTISPPPLQTHSRRKRTMQTTTTVCTNVRNIQNNRQEDQPASNNVAQDGITPPSLGPTQSGQ